MQMWTLAIDLSGYIHILTHVVSARHPETILIGSLSWFKFVFSTLGILILDGDGC